MHHINTYSEFGLIETLHKYFKITLWVVINSHFHIYQVKVTNVYTDMCFCSRCCVGWGYGMNCSYDFIFLRLSQLIEFCFSAFIYYFCMPAIDHLCFIFIVLSVYCVFQIVPYLLLCSFWGCIEGMLWVVLRFPVRYLNTGLIVQVQGYFTVFIPLLLYSGLCLITNLSFNT